MNDLSIITVTHQSALFIEDQVFSTISGGIKLSMEQIVVDNASSDGTLEILDRLCSVKVIKNCENVGFAAANNQAFAQAKGRYLLFLNPDMRIKEGSLDILVERMDNDLKVGIASCLLIDGFERPLVTSYPRLFPRVLKEILWLLRLDFFCKKPWEQNKAEPEMVKGAFMLARRELLEKLGFAFDPRYFLLYEDTDLCREARRLGYKIGYYSDICCIDFNSRSFAVKTGKWIYQRFTESMLRYFRKWEPWYCWIWIALLIPFGYLLRFPPGRKKG
jgi:N-acetylglucosaminyl-diphospho-decaprenol L-rhamnosyltransferase